jgi:hypothetical protein
MTDYTAEITVDSLTKEPKSKITTEGTNETVGAIPENLLQIIATGGDKNSIPDTPRVAEAGCVALPAVTVWDYEQAVHERLKALVLAGCVTFPDGSATNDTTVEMGGVTARGTSWDFTFKISGITQVTDATHIAHINEQLRR